MKIAFSIPSTQVDKGYLFGRADLFPEPGDQTYDLHYVYVPVIGDNKYEGALDKFGRPIDAEDYQKWVDSLPHIWRVNPALCLFIKLPETFQKQELTDWLSRLLTPTMVGSLDSALILPDSAHRISAALRNKLAMSDQVVKATDLVDLVASTKLKLAELGTTDLATGESTTLETGSIDVGYQATSNGGTTVYGPDWTYINLENSANATGTLDTFQIRLETATGTVSAGTCYLVSGTTYKTRDSESMGAIANGSLVTVSGKSVDVTLGDFAIGYIAASAHWDANFGTSTIMGATSDGDKTIPNTETTYSAESNRCNMGLYATGTEAGGAAFIPKIIIT